MRGLKCRQFILPCNTCNLKGLIQCGCSISGYPVSLKVVKSVERKDYMILLQSWFWIVSSQLSVCVPKLVSLISVCSVEHC